MGKIGAFVAGGVVGACIALACAPQVGRDTRAAVVDKANAAWGSAQGVVSGEVSVKDVAQNVAAQAQGVAQTVAAQAQTLAAQAQEAAAGVQSRVQEVASGAAATSNDELREKIEAARQRIAAQVVKNVEESSAAAEAVEAQPVEAEVVEVEAAEAAE